MHRNVLELGHRLPKFDPISNMIPLLLLGFIPPDILTITNQFSKKVAIIEARTSRS